MPARSSRLVQPEDLLRLVSAADPRFADDDLHIAFVRKGFDARQAKTSEIWRTTALGTVQTRRLTKGPRDSMPRPAPTDSRLLFVRARVKQAPQLCMTRMSGGAVRTLTRLPEGSIAALEWSPDGTRIAFKWRETMEDQTAAAAKARTRRGASTSPLVIDDPWYRLDGDGYFGSARYRLFVLDLDRSARPREVFSNSHLDDFTFDWSPDGRVLAVACNRDPRWFLHPERTEILLVDATGRKAPRPIVGLPLGPKDAPRWSPDGTHLAWAGRRGRSTMYDTENVELWAAEVDAAATKPMARHVRCLTGTTDYCLLVGTLSDTADASFSPWFRWASDGASLFLRIGWHGAGRIASVSARGGEVALHTDGGADLMPLSLAMSGDRIACVRSAPTEPPEIAVAEVLGHHFEVATRTRLNAAFRRDRVLVEPTEHWILPNGAERRPRGAGARGEQSKAAVHTWVMRPPRGAPARRGATVLQVHGGPHAQYGVTFFHEFQVLAAAGYTVVFSNPRGSKGYGARFCGAIKGAWGTADWKDVSSVTRFMGTLPGVRASRLAIMGGSYGGYMTNWAIAHSRAYRAAITDRCVSDLVSMCGTSDFVEVPDLYWRGVSWDRPQALWRSSPIAHFKGVRTPTLIIHSEGDLRCNIEQGEQIHAALVTQGVPCRFVRYPRETSHGMSRIGPADLRIHRLHQILDWWRTHLG